MGKLNKFFILLTAFVLVLNAVHAAPFNAKVTPIKDKIVVDEVAEFDVAIENYLETTEEFNIKKAGYPFWDMYTKPLQNPITLKVPAQSNASIRLFVEPLYITSVDTYTLDTAIILDRTGQEQKVPITIGIKSTEPLISGYIPTVLASVSVFPESIDPREDATIKIVLSNQNVINYTNLTIKISSKLISEELYTQLGPKEDKTIELTKKLEDMAMPQQDKLVVAVLKDERVIVRPNAKDFEVKEYLIQEELPKEQSFLKIRKGIKVVSNDPDYKGQIKIGTTAFKNLFSTTSPRAQSINADGKQYLIWQVKLGKDNTMSVYINENYRPIVIFFAIVIFAIVLYFVFRSPIVVRKGVANISMSEGGVSEAKIVVRIKNRSSQQLANIEVMDNVPNIAHVEKELSIGSMQPHAILRHPKKGIIIKWTLESLEPGDERVLSYRMKSRLAILGEFNLPAANARCKIGNKVVISNSNRMSING